MTYSAVDSLGKANETKHIHRERRREMKKVHRKRGKKRQYAYGRVVLIVTIM